jgi:Fe-S cluster assembly iron-binding protein IscA
MTLDESQENDIVFTDRGIDYLIEKNLFEEVKPVKVDFQRSFRGSGFRLTSNLSKRMGFGGGCGSC